MKNENAIPRFRSEQEKHLWVMEQIHKTARGGNKAVQAAIRKERGANYLDAVMRGENPERRPFAP